MPWITDHEAELIRRLPGVRDVNIGEYTDGPVGFGASTSRACAIAGFSPTWILVNGGDILAGRNFTPLEYAAGARVAVINDKLAQSLFPGRDPIGKTIKIFGVPFTVIGDARARPPRCSATRTSPAWPSPTRSLPRWRTTRGAGWRSRWCPPRGHHAEAQDR